MTTPRARHSRQTRLAEVGPAGQHAITRALAQVRTRGLAAEIEARYLAGAGFGEVRVPDETTAAAARAVDSDVAIVVDASLAGEARNDEGDLFAIVDPSARAIARGAHGALVAMRRALSEATR